MEKAKSINCQNCYTLLAEKTDGIKFDPNIVDTEIEEITRDIIKIKFICPECKCRVEVIN